MKLYFEWAVLALETAAVAVLVLAAAISLARFLYGCSKGRAGNAFQAYRKELGRGLLMGLELLIAAELILTVAVEHTFASLGKLAVIVVIRTIVGFALELEITGRLPWQSHADERKTEKD